MKNSLEVIIILQMNFTENTLFLDYISPHFDIALGLYCQL